MQKIPCKAKVWNGTGALLKIKMWEGIASVAKTKIPMEGCCGKNV